MIEFANVSQKLITLFPLEANLTAVATFDSDQTTAPRVGDLARLSYMTASVAYHLNMEGSAAVVTVQARAGGVSIGEVQVSANGAGTYAGEFAVDLTSVKGATPISLRVSVDTADPGAATASETMAVLNLNHPVIITGSGGC